MITAYLLFTEYRITPGQYYAMSTGEKALIKAFLNYKIEREREAMSFE